MHGAGCTLAADGPVRRPAPLKLGSAPTLVAAPPPLGPGLWLSETCLAPLQLGRCQAGWRLQKGLLLQELGALPVLGYPRGLTPQSSGTWGLPSSQIPPFLHPVPPVPAPIPSLPLQ